MRTGITGGCLIRKGSGIVTTQEKLRLEECRILTCSARDFLARHSQSLDGGKDLQTQGEPCSLKLPDWLKPDGLLIFSLKTYPDCFRMTKAGRFTPSSVRFMNWGIIWNEDGYVSASDVTFEVSEDGSIAEVEMKDEYSRIDISKTDLTTREELPGATLQIIDKDGKVLEEWVTDGKPHRVEKLPVGEELILRETSAPDGYIVAEEMKFTLEDTMEVQKAEMKDDYLYGRLMLVKTDGETGKAVAGAEFEIRNKTTGMIMELLVTDADGKAESSDLLIGMYGVEGLRELFEYECVETKAPEGYVLDDTVHPVKFELKDQTGDHIVVTLEVKNQPEKEAPAVPKTGDRPWLPMTLAAISIGAAVFFAAVTVKKHKINRMAGMDAGGPEGEEPEESVHEDGCE